ncbi:MAG: DegT/DnrJ/EryC1/StrS family aminotransferase [Pseudomonadota bacterium]|nr:DegT/DnrJ/EryC1/StrS family aminotransferase [Pseudomonadota bacterium]
MRVPFSYLDRQFKAGLQGEKEQILDLILADIKEFVQTGDFTLGKKGEEFEREFASFIGVKHAIGVNSGTDALFLSLKALGIGPGDEVITCAETFIATAAAIVAAGAKPVFVDVNDEFTIDTALIERAITKRTKAIMPVWFTGNAPDMDEIMAIAVRHGLVVLEDSCTAINASYRGKHAGTFGAAGAFSFHPLKNLNVWSDGGMIVTNDDRLNEKLRMQRNYGLKSRDEADLFGYNSRLDTLQAVVALRLLPDVKACTDRRIAIAETYDRVFSNISQIQVPPRHAYIRHVYHLYMIRGENRDALLRYCQEKGVETKIHYPIPLPYQKCCNYLGYKPGDFPRTERDCRTIITLPAHPYLTDEEVEYTIETLVSFYRREMA